MPNDIYGTEGDDVIHGTAQDDKIWGYGGADSLYGEGGDDWLYGGAGADRLDGGAGIDGASYYGETAGVTVNLATGKCSGGNAQGDTLLSIENVSGSQGNDNVTGNAGANTLQGWNGNDVLRGGAGADRLDGGAGIDTASYYAESASVTVNLSIGTVSGGNAQGDILISIENVSGGHGWDSLTGNAGTNTLAGYEGNDTLRGGAGADRLDGGIGIDTASYYGAITAVMVNLQTGTGSGGDAQGDTFVWIENVSGSNANDTLTGNAGINRLQGDDGDDTLQGGDGQDALVGGVGADRLDGGAGTDTASYYGETAAVAVDLSTGTGSGGNAQGDTFVAIENVSGSQSGDILVGDSGANGLAGDYGDDVLRGGAGADRLDGGSGVDTVSYEGLTMAVTVNLHAGTGSGGEAQDDTLVAIENASGGQAGDTLVGSAGRNTLAGNEGDDLLRGFNGSDRLYGGAGADKIYGESGDDWLYGGAGADLLDGGGGIGGGVDGASYSDEAVGVTVDLSTHHASGGNAEGDILIRVVNVSGSQGDDTLIGDAMNNTLFGGNGNDVLRGGAGADRIDGGAGVDTVTYSGEAVGVTLDLSGGGRGIGGNAQGDFLAAIENASGSQGDDILIGSAGANTLAGNEGQDTLTGGAGGDRFAFASVGDSVVGANADRITDFSQAEADRVDLSAIDADTTTAGDQVFSFIGSGPYTQHAGELRFAVSDGQTTIAGDVNGDGISDFHIVLEGVGSLQGSDFIL